MKSVVLFASLALAFALDAVSATGHIANRREKHLGRRACKGNHLPANNTLSSTASSSAPASTSTSSSNSSSGGGSSGCFPALDFNMPSSPPSSLDNWWCDMDTEYAFVGFSYEVTACMYLIYVNTSAPLTPSSGQSASQLKSDFKDIRTRFKGRYVRLYGACDNKGF